MTRYFFHTRDGDKTDLDDEGVELPDDESAKNAAKELLADMSREKLPNGDFLALTVTVQNADGAQVYIAELKLEGH
ncbi:hypothetical protein B6S44_27610 [Bosea sp. Tri-44]|uniref:DUF6894 family protein n=1 Tax=Bosea sp. Tri-44 TaxID=1972137 RepID=UPI00100EE558|nr:hypothetical protein [Bosea sp. Tri-44]RXT44602.1 hypothetical protein B6S44_27610 [Bosea sp. Tri-44]